MFPSVMSNSTSLSEVASVSPGIRARDFGTLNSMVQTNLPDQQHTHKIKKKRNLPGNPDPDAEAIALSPRTLLETNRFVCEICNKGFKRDQNLQLHRRGHNLPWKLKQRSSKENKKKVYVCPEPTCVHHHPSRALGDLTGIKKHYCRKHGEKKYKCEKCSKIYAVQSDWKAHSKTCGTREYRCNCGTVFSRKDSFITHRTFCDALAEESARLSVNSILENAKTLATQSLNLYPQNPSSFFPFSSYHHLPTPQDHIPWAPPQNPNQVNVKPEAITLPLSPSPFHQEPPPPLPKTFISSTLQGLHFSAHQTSKIATSAHLSATALLQKAASLAAQPGGHVPSTMTWLDMDTMGHSTTGMIMPENLGFASENISTWHNSDVLTRDFLGLTGGGVEFPTAYDHEQSLLKHQRFSFTTEAAAPEAWGNY